jgi:hypothetical protein
MGNYRLGGILADQGRLDEGGELLRQALAITEGVYGPDHYDVALVLDKLAASQAGPRPAPQAQRSAS